MAGVGMRRRTGRAGWLGMAMSVALTVLAGSGCGRERICNEGEYPVKSIRFPATGRTCVKDGDVPPKGYETYPPGEVPTYIGDEFDD